MVSNEILDRIAGEIGRTHGYSSVSAEFAEFSNLTIRWSRTSDWIRISVSDYLSDAPEEVITALIGVVFGQLEGNRSRYPQVLIDYLTSPAFVPTHRPTFVKRNGGMTGTAVGRHKDLSDSYKRLAAAGLIEDDPNILLNWTSAEPKEYTQYSVLMKTIAVSDILDDPDTPDFVLDWLVYHDCCVIASGYDPTTVRKTVPMKIARKFEKMDDALAYLDNLSDSLGWDEDEDEDEEDY